MSHKPPLSRAVKISSTEVGYHVTDGYRVTDGKIAAIDFGTTSVSLAYTTKGDDEEAIVNYPLEKSTFSTRILNAILLKEEGTKMKIVSMGKLARSDYASLDFKEFHNHVYFERIKMLLKKEEKINRKTLVESFTGKKLYLIEVIAFVLKYLKDLLMKHFSKEVVQLKTTDFDWVITVPAIWDARGKRMMREAAYLAGLLTESGGIDQFSSITGPPPLPSEVNPDKLSLALEPESAALYSQNDTVKKIESNKSRAALSRPTEYMVIDIGGGTVDITAHIEVDGGIQIDNIPTGNAWGGTQVNEAFSKRLQDIINDPGFSNFLASGHASRRKAILNELLYGNFEEKKVEFGSRYNCKFTLNLPQVFYKFYSKELARANEVYGITYDESIGKVVVSKEVVESELFGPALDGIIDCTLKAIKSSAHKFDTFYLVGGFGGCDYVHEKVSAAIEKSMGKSCKVHVPTSPQLAVATGAVMWRMNPEKTKARRSDATYGIDVSIPFDTMKHDEYYKKYNEEQKEYKCNNVFDVFLEKGELAKSDEVMTASITPARQSMTSMLFDIYCTPNLGVQYTEDKNGKSTVTEIGRLVMDIPNPDNLPREKRIVDVTMDFSGTEIQAKAKYRVTGKEVTTVCDFLSAQQRPCSC